MSKGIYIGAGTDFKYFKLMDKEIKTIICIDGQPFSEFGKEASWTNKHPFKCCPVMPCCFKYNGYSRPNFLNNLLEKARLYNFKFISKNGDKYIFESSSQKVIYFINTGMPDDIDKIKDDISDFEHIIVMGHDPNSEFMKYSKKKITLWGNINTVYKDTYYDIFAEEDGDDNNLIYKLNYGVEYENNFEKFKMIKNDSIIEFNVWDDFLKFSGNV